MVSHDAASGRSVEASGKTVEQAIDNALARLGVPREDASVQVLREASRGVLGFGAHDAIVRVTQIVRTPPAPPEEGDPVVAPPLAVPPLSEVAEVLDEEVEGVEGERPSSPIVEEVAEQPGAVMSDVEEAPEEDYGLDEDEDDDEARGPRGTVTDEELLEIGRGVLLDILERMNVIADVLATWREPEADEEEGTLVLDIIGDDLGLLIGRRGETLKELQYILRLIVGHRIQGWANIIVDVEGYKQRRERNIRQLARRMAERVLDTQRPVHMEPMNAYERRIVHIELRDLPGVSTRSSGEGDRRKVGIFPANGESA